MPTPTPSPPANVIFCTRTSSCIDYVGPSRDADARLTQLMPEYGPDLIILPEAEAQRRYEAKFITAPHDIDADHFHDMLNILPPVAWTCTGSSESFRICEALAGRVQAHYVRIGDRYATFADTPTAHHDCCLRAAKHFAANPRP